MKKLKDLKQMLMNIAIIKSENKNFIKAPDIKNIDSHIIESMFKRYIQNA